MSTDLHRVSEGRWHMMWPPLEFRKDSDADEAGLSPVDIINPQAE